MEVVMILIKLYLCFLFTMFAFAGIVNA